NERSSPHDIASHACDEAMAIGRGKGDPSRHGLFRDAFAPPALSGPVRAARLAADAPRLWRPARARSEGGVRGGSARPHRPARNPIGADRQARAARAEAALSGVL